MRFLRWGLGLVVMAVMLGGGWLLWQLAATRPSLEGVQRLEGGPERPVTVTRDAHGVPHVFGSSDADVFFGLGFVHADERFFQMDMVRRFVFGRLSAALGAATVAADARSRTLGYPRAAEAMARRLEPEARATIEAYVAGVNARLEAGNLSFEHRLLGIPLEPYRVEDVMAVAVYMTHDLMTTRSDQTLPAQLAEVLDAGQVAEFLPPYPADAPTTLRAEDFPAPPAGVEGAAGAEEDPVNGSNAWVVSGARSETGAPLLANDPHLSLGLPSLWYFARLALEDGDVVGATIPGAPMVVLGRNAHIAWGCTNSGFDVVDLVPLEPSAPTELREETIEVAGGEPVKLSIRSAEAGPVLDRRWFDFAALWDAPIAWRSPVHAKPNGLPGAVLRMMKAKDWDGFVAATEGWTVPMQNMLFASTEGDIGYTTAGLLPIRDGQGAWTGFVPHEALPRVLNPPRGFVVSANNRVVPDGYAYDIPGRYVTYRAKRLEAALAETEQHSLESFAKLQMDVVSTLAQELLPVIRTAEPRTEAGREVQAQLSAWDGELEASKTAPRLYAAFYRALHPLLYADELGHQAEAFSQHKPVFLHDVLLGSAGRWCDDVGTEAEESCAQTVGAALDQAGQAELASKAPWGAVHRARFEHRVMSRIPLLGALFAKSAGMGGDGTTPNVGNHGLSGPYDVRHSASLRAVYDLSDLDRSRFVHAPGQSGHPWSPHFDDLLGAWERGEGIRIPTRFGPEDGRKLVLEAR